MYILYFSELFLTITIRNINKKILIKMRLVENDS